MYESDKELRGFYEFIDFSKPMILIDGKRYGMSLYGAVQAIKYIKGVGSN
jgi:hypothetical protein